MWLSRSGVGFSLGLGDMITLFVGGGVSEGPVGESHKTATPEVSKRMLEDLRDVA